MVTNEAWPRYSDRLCRLCKDDRINFFSFALTRSRYVPRAWVPSDGFRAEVSPVRTRTVTTRSTGRYWAYAAEGQETAGDPCFGVEKWDRRVHFVVGLNGRLGFAYEFLQLISFGVYRHDTHNSLIRYQSQTGSPQQVESPEAWCTWQDAGTCSRASGKAQNLAFFMAVDR